MATEAGDLVSADYTTCGKTGQALSKWGYVSIFDRRREKGKEMMEVLSREAVEGLNDSLHPEIY